MFPGHPDPRNTHTEICINCNLLSLITVKAKFAVKLHRSSF